METNIGKVGTEVYIFREEQLKTRKIWSIPISLVMVLALTALVSFSGIVQAQTITDPADGAFEFVIESGTAQGATVGTIPTTGFDPNSTVWILVNGNDLPFAIQRGASDAGVIQVNGTLAVQEYSFTVNVSGTETTGTSPDIVTTTKSDSVDVTISVIQGNTRPVWDPEAPASDMVQDYVADPSADPTPIQDFGGFVTDPDHPVLTYSIAAAAADADADPPITAADVTNATTAAASLAFAGSVLQTVPATALVFNEGDNPATTPEVETEFPLDNTHVYVITVADDSDADPEVTTDQHTFTLTVTRAPVDPEPEVTRVYEVSEDAPSDGSGDAGVTIAIEDAGGTAITTGYNIADQYPLAPLDMNTPETDDDDTGDIWEIADDGVLSLLADAAPLDFERGGDLNRFSITVTAGTPTVTRNLIIRIVNAHEEPEFADDMASAGVVVIGEGEDAVNWLYVLESASIGNNVGEVRADGKANDATAPGMIVATDQDAGDAIAYSLHSPDDPDSEDVDESEAAYAGGLFAIHPSSGQIVVAAELDADDAEQNIELVVRATDLPRPESDEDDAESTSRAVEYEITIRIVDDNEAPSFVNPSLSERVPETTATTTPIGSIIATYTAIDPDGAGDILTFELRGAIAAAFFSIDPDTGVLTTVAELNYEDYPEGYGIEIYVVDEGANTDNIKLQVDLIDLNDSAPVLSGTTVLTIPETTKPGTIIATYTATDEDTVGTVKLSLVGSDTKNYSIDTDTGDLSTAVWLDADTNPSDTITVVASDGVAAHEQRLPVTITITDAPDSISNIRVSKANPVPGPQQGEADDSLADAPENFVSSEFANWGTTLRIAVTSQSPNLVCGADCVFVELEADSADTNRLLKARRTLTQAEGNVFVAAVMLVSGYENPQDQDQDMDAGDRAYLEVDEEDEITIKFGNARDSIDVENDAPEFDNFAPEHETALDDADVDYIFTVTDSISGIPNPEDLPDNDGDDEYTAVVAVVSGAQCTNVDEKDIEPGHIDLHDGGIDCGGSQEFRPVVDDKDFDEVDAGFDVETTIAFPKENKIYYVTFIVCDAAGNCVSHDPDVNGDDVALAEITIDTEEPELEEARTGLTWDSTDNEYDDNRSFIQMVFTDLTSLNPDTVEIDDFVVEGHSIAGVHVYENPDDEDVTWGDSGVYAVKAIHRDIENSVFIELVDELLADETPDVTMVPNGIEDQAGNEQDTGDMEADDWISPAFAIQSITSTRQTTQDQILAGDGDEVTIVVTADERLDTPRPTVSVTLVNAPSGSVDTEGVDDCNRGKGERERGEIVHEGNDKCQDSNAATGGTLSYTIEKVTNTEWIVAIDEPEDTGYYSFYIWGRDRSPQDNRGSEGVSPDAIVTDFFDSDGDVNADDAVFFEGDISLAKPRVRVSGQHVTDDEPDLEYRSPLFVELDFTKAYSRDCDEGDDDADCANENSEYAEDNFDAVMVTMFSLDGVDSTDSVKTTDDETFLVAIEGISVGDHTIEIQAVDQAGNELEDVLEIDFEVSERDPFGKRLSPGWNLVSLPGEPADSSIDAVFGSGVEVRTVYTYDPVVPGGWMVAVRETLDSDWQGDLTEITGRRGYWVLSDAIQDWEVGIPRLAGGAVGTGTPIQPPVIPLYAGWNLIPVTDVRGNALDDGASIDAHTYLNSLDDGLDLARVLGFDTIRNQWNTVLDPEIGSAGDLNIGSGYWVFVREAASLVPGGLAE